MPTRDIATPDVSQLTPTVSPPSGAHLNGNGNAE
jgi:hypothetical protein